MVLFLGSCSTLPKTPDNLVQNIEDYRGQTLRVRGTVSQSVTIPATELSVFRLEGNQEGILVLSPVSRPNGTQATITARVYLLADNQSGQGAISGVQDFAQMLKDRDILHGSFVDATARVIIEAIRLAARAGQQIYFLVETND